MCMFPVDELNTFLLVGAIDHQIKQTLYTTVESTQWKPTFVVRIAVENTVRKELGSSIGVQNSTTALIYFFRSITLQILNDKYEQ